MCGIIGAVTNHNITEQLLLGLKRLEYRGYDSAGIIILDNNSTFVRVRSLGKVSKLREAIYTQDINGATGIAHTRWATHGKPSEANAHPHVSNDRVAIVHNGIIENYKDLQQEVTANGYQTESETDTEVVAHLIHANLTKTNDLLNAVFLTLKRLTGAYALAIIDQQQPGRIIAARCGSPLVVGVSNNGHYIASDPLALLEFTQTFIYLEEGDVADISADKITIYDQSGKLVKREAQISKVNATAVDRGHYRHYMQKEIYEQPEAIKQTLAGRISHEHVLEQAFGTEAINYFKQVENIQLVACGTSYHASLVGREWLENIAGIPCNVTIASEFSYRNNIVKPNTLFITLSQSGETSDTLTALRSIKDKNYLASVCICNTPESSLVRESDLVFMTQAGPEIGVASTKAFTTQLVGLLLLAISIAQQKQKIMPEKLQWLEAIHRLPEYAKQILKLDKSIQTLAKQLVNKSSCLFLGRQAFYAIALEAALKLKEISYIHAEAYPTGELKHGPLALVDEDMPVIVLADDDAIKSKLNANVQEIAARGGRLFIFANENINIETNKNIQTIALPAVYPLVAPIIYTIPMQLLAYHVASHKGTDIDQPRNLAKAVTVE